MMEELIWTGAGAITACDVDAVRFESARARLEAAARETGTKLDLRLVKPGDNVVANFHCGAGEKKKKKKNQFLAVSHTPIIKITTPQSIFGTACDVVVPNALGACLDDTTIAMLHPDVKIVCGAANNQLKSEERHAAMLQARGISCVPKHDLVGPDCLYKIATLIPPPPPFFLPPPPPQPLCPTLLRTGWALCSVPTSSTGT
jgi:hypothetical protein